MLLLPYKASEIFRVSDTLPTPRNNDNQICSTWFRGTLFRSLQFWQFDQLFILHSYLLLSQNIWTCLSSPSFPRVQVLSRENKNASKDGFWSSRPRSGVQIWPVRVRKQPSTHTHERTHVGESFQGFIQTNFLIQFTNPH